MDPKKLARPGSGQDLPEARVLGDVRHVQRAANGGEVDHAVPADGTYHGREARLALEELDEGRAGCT